MHDEDYGYCEYDDWATTDPAVDLESDEQCYDCGGKVEWSWIHNDLWASIVAPEERIEWICVRCISQRLGRPLAPNDLNDFFRDKAVLIKRLSIPYGYCYCDCGEKTEPYKHTDKRAGAIKGQPRRYLRGHGCSPKGPKYEIVDLGYTTSCWIWKTRPNAGGYGRTPNNGYAHRDAYIAAHGPVPEEKVIDHLCHNADKSCRGNACLHRRCVNPDHLEAVPQRKNQERGRAPKLTIEQVREIRNRPRTRGMKTAIAQEFGVHPTTVGMLLNHPDRVWVDETT